MRELSIFIDESGVFGPLEPHSPFYIVSFVMHDQNQDITAHLDTIHSALMVRGLDADHPIHTGPLIRREQAYRWMGLPERRALFRVLVDFVRRCEVAQHSLVFDKRETTDTDHLVSLISREVSAFIRDNLQFFTAWDRIVIYYDGGQKQLTNVVNSVFSAHLATVEVRKVLPSAYSLFQAADLCCTLALLRTKIQTGGLSPSERDFFSTPKDGAERALRKGYFKTIDAKQFRA